MLKFIIPRLSATGGSLGMTKAKLVHFVIRTKALTGSRYRSWKESRDWRISTDAPIFEGNVLFDISPGNSNCLV